MNLGITHLHCGNAQKKQKAYLNVNFHLDAILPYNRWTFSIIICQPKAFNKFSSDLDPKVMRDDNKYRSVVGSGD